MNLVATLRWDPTIRGILFPAIQFLVLCGSCYLILATNVGNRLGFLISSAAFWGWMTLMAIVWLIYGIGPKGDAPSWKHNEELFTTKYAQYAKVKNLPDTPSKKAPVGWKVLPAGSPVRGEAQSVIDAHLGKQATEWVSIGGYETGGEQRLKVWPKRKKIDALQMTREKAERAANDLVPRAQRKKSSELYRAKRYHWYDPRDYEFRGLLHGKRYFVGQQGSVLKEQKVIDGIRQYKDDGTPDMVTVMKAGKSVVDPKGKIISHVLVRDLGTLRLRSFRVFFFSLILTIVSVIALHYRDKKVMASLGKIKAKAA